MATSKRRGEEDVLGKNQTLGADDRPRAQFTEDHTVFDIHSMGRAYKLQEAYANVRNLEYRSDKAVKVQTFREYLTTRRPAARRRPFTATTKPRPRYPADEAYRNRLVRPLYPKGKMLVLVDKSVYSQVSSSVNQYVLDVGRDGYWATIHVVQGGTPADVQSYITRRRPVGVLLVGAVAAPWFELEDDFHGRSEFPCDLYYMDTSGTWTDPDGDGKFSSHSGDVDPEIWVGRLWTPTAAGNDAAMINDYFCRNHRFRVGQLGHARSALAFVDDDWQGFDDCAFDLQFPASAITKYTSPNQTDADLYKAEVNSLRSWVQLCAHSWTHGHALHVPSAGGNEYIHVDYFRDVNPPNAHFYNLFCCGPGKYTTADYLAGWYIFDKAGGGVNPGLATIASAKSGSMLYFEDFYRPLGNGKAIGDAFVAWWQARGPTHDLGEKRWFYGLVLLGDPTLTWWRGVVPQPKQPQDGDVFDHWPRKMQLRWDPVKVAGARYSIEVDYYDGSWAEGSGRSCYTYHNVSGKTLDHTFVGAQRGRWRVRAVIGGQQCSWSPWSYFRFTV